MTVQTSAAVKEFLASVSTKYVPTPKTKKVKVTFVSKALLFKGTSAASFLASVS